MTDHKRTLANDDLTEADWHVPDRRPRTPSSVDEVRDRWFPRLQDQDYRDIAWLIGTLESLRESVADDLRAQGWTVAVHNDYRLNGKLHTFWLVTRGSTAIKGEGETDQEALQEIRARITDMRASQ